MVFSELTQAEKEVLCMITQEYLSAKQIASRRKCTKQAVHKIIKSLKEKGAYNLGCQLVDQTNGTSQPVNQIRLHAQQFVMRILWKDHRYKKLLEKANQIELDGNTIKLWNNTIEIYSNTSFYGDDLQQAMAKSIKYWDILIARLEHDVHCILKKPRSQNIKMVRAHYAETNNEIAKDIDNSGDRWIKVYAKEDSRLWFIIDNSYNLHEAETVHSKTGKEDMEKVKAVFNDIRDHSIDLPSETKEMIRGLAESTKNLLAFATQQNSIISRTNESVNWLAENIKSHGPAWFGMSKEAKEISRGIKTLNKVIYQKRLGDYL